MARLIYLIVKEDGIYKYDKNMLTYKVSEKTYGLKEGLYRYMSVDYKETKVKPVLWTRGQQVSSDRLPMKIFRDTNVK